MIHIPSSGLVAAHKTPSSVIRASERNLGLLSDIGQEVTLIFSRRESIYNPVNVFYNLRRKTFQASSCLQ